MGNIEERNECQGSWKEQQPYLCWMTGVEGVGRRTIEKLIHYAGSPKEVYEMKVSDMIEVISEKKAKALVLAKNKNNIFQKYEELHKKGICFYSIYHPRYPKRLKNIPDMPYGIYVEGELPQENIPSIAIIGARQCSGYGQLMAQVCGRDLAMAGMNIVSGMARGIDGISQKAALEAGGKIYAVLGCGTNICYPSENRGIYNGAKENGAIISEYPPGTPPAPGLFPRRNRIISGLADLVLIIEARAKSGTLITADMALEQGKEVYVLPGRVTDPLSQGCNRMLKQGAGLFTSVKELLEESGLGIKPEDAGKIKLDMTGTCFCQEQERGKESILEERVMDALDFYPKDTDCLMQETQIGYRLLIHILSKICLEGKAERIAANQFIKRL